MHANAIKVLNSKGALLGWIAREDAGNLAPLLDAGEVCTGRVHQLRGGVPEFPSYGCRISIQWTGEKPRAFQPLDADQSAFRSRRRSGCAALGGVAIVCIFASWQFIAWS